MSPSQLSNAVKSIGAGTSASHSTSTSAGASGAAGAVVSSTVIVCDTLLSLPHSSTNVHVLTVTNEFGQSPGVVSSTALTVISPSQLSNAVKSTDAGISASHSTNTSAGASGATGAVSSLIVIVATISDSFPQSSVAVKVTSVTSASLFAQGLNANKSAISPKSFSIVTS